MANGPVNSGIVPRRYKSGSVIYFEGDNSEYIYILKSGGIILTSINLETGEEVKENVSQGEFFGVKSSIGKYPREETAQVISDTIVLLLSMEEFERLVVSNVQIVKKMLRVFSNQLRRIGRTVRSVMGESGVLNPDVELFKIGEYYFKNAVYKQSEYAYKKYIEYYPDGDHAKKSMERINSIKNGIGGDDIVEISAPAVENDLMPPEIENSSDDEFDFEMGSEESENSLDDDNSFSDFSEFLDDDSLSDLDMEFDFEDNQNSKLKQADELYKSEDFNSAYTKYKEIIDAGTENIAEKDFAFAELGFANCLQKIGKAKLALETYTKLIKSNFDTEITKKAYFGVSLLFNSVNQKDKAVAYLKKIISMEPQDNVTNDAKKELVKLQNG